MLVSVFCKKNDTACKSDAACKSSLLKPLWFYLRYFILFYFKFIWWLDAGPPSPADHLRNVFYRMGLNDKVEFWWSCMLGFSILPHYACDV